MQETVYAKRTKNASGYMHKPASSGVLADTGTCEQQPEHSCMRQTHAMTPCWSKAFWVKLGIGESPDGRMGPRKAVNGEISFLSLDPHGPVAVFPGSGWVCDPTLGKDADALLVLASDVRVTTVMDQKTRSEASDTMQSLAHQSCHRKTKGSPPWSRKVPGDGSQDAGPAIFWHMRYLFL